MIGAQPDFALASHTDRLEEYGRERIAAGIAIRGVVVVLHAEDPAGAVKTALAKLS